MEDTKISKEHLDVNKKILGLYIPKLEKVMGSEITICDIQQRIDDVFFNHCLFVGCTPEIVLIVTYKNQVCVLGCTNIHSNEVIDFVVLKDGCLQLKIPHIHKNNVGIVDCDKLGAIEV